MSEKRRKIIYLITKSNWGGAQRYVYDLATASAAAGYDVAALYGDEGGTLAARLAEAGVRSVALRKLARDVAPGADAATFGRLVRILRAEKPDIVHANSSKMGGVGALAARVAGVPKIVFTVHGWPFNETERPWWQRGAIWVASWATALFATDVITIASREYSQGLRMPLARRKMSLIRNGIDAARPLRGRAASRAFLAERQGYAPSFFNNGYLIGSIGELTPNKGFIYAIAAMERAPRDARLVIIGDGESRARLEQEIRDRSLATRVFLAGFIENAADSIPAFDAFVLPSVKEGLPYVLLEAGRAGVPVVATAIGGVGDIVEDGVSGILVPPRDSCALADALVSVRGSSGERMATRLSEHVRAAFTKERMVAETLALYAVSSPSSRTSSR